MAAPHPLLVPLIDGEPIPDDAVVTIDVVRSAQEHGVAAFLDAVVTERGLATSPPQVKQLLAMNVLETTHENRNAMITIDHLQDAAASLGVEVAIFKGVTVGSRFHPDPELRRTIDVDAFVDPACLDRSDRRQSALSLLTAQRPAALVAAYRRKVFPPLSIVDLRSGRSGLSYPVALANWRIRQRSTLTAWKAEAGE